MARIFWDYKRTVLGLTFILPLVKKIIVYPSCAVACYYIMHYATVDPKYYDEYGRQIREQQPPILN